MIQAGNVCEITKAGAAVGTRIEVRDLFFNVPVRLKFTKSKRTEVSEIDRLLRAFAYSNLSVGWRFFVDDKIVFSCLPDGDTEISRAQLLLGQDHAGFLYQIEKDLGLLTVHGVIGAPMMQRRDARGLIFFINNRLVSDKKLTLAVKTAFRSLIEVGHHPVSILRISIAPDEVDVNVHPRKAEVRFRDDRQIFAEIVGGLSEFLAKTPWLSARNLVKSPLGSPQPIGGQSGFLKGRLNM